MYWWNIDALKKVFTTRSLTENETFQYFMADTIFTALMLIPIPGIMYNQIDVYNGIMNVIIVIAGTYYVYRLNGGNQGHEFLPRMFALSWVVGIRYTVLVFLPVLIVSYLFVFTSEEGEQTTWFDVAALTVLLIGFFWVLGKHIKSVADLKQGKDQSVAAV